MKKQEWEMLSEEEKNEMKVFQKKVATFLAIYGVLCLVILVLFKAVFMLSYVPSSSMEGSIKEGDFLISSRYDVGAEELERYDVLTFTVPDEPKNLYVKRLIGLPGETIEVSGGKVYADGVELDKSFIKGWQDKSGDGVYEVPEGCYFFLGDNRNDSYDSRFWTNKYVPLENIQAKVRWVVFPFSDAGSMEYEK